MSVWVTALLGHNWPRFSLEIVEEIARAISTEMTSAKWRQHPTFQSPEEEFDAEGTVSFVLPSNYSIRIGKSLLYLGHPDRWSTFLANATTRHQFVATCRKVAELTTAMEILLLPEGTVLMDDFYNGVGFEEIKRAACRKLGDPDLDVAHIYTEDDIRQMPTSRVHYFLVNTSELDAPKQGVIRSGPRKGRFPPNKMYKFSRLPQ